MTTPAAPITLPTGAFEQPALDHAGLRAEGIRLLGRLSGAQWTDFNTSDPGVTLLEQLCYAITDLAYRTEHPVADLIAGTDTAVALPGPAVILTGDPVTRADLRKLALDVDGVGNAWVEPATPDPVFYHHRASGELRLEVDPADLDARAVRLTGLHDVWLQASDGLPSDAALAAVAARLHAHRGLGVDFTPALLGVHPIWLQAGVEIEAVEDPVALLADILEQIEAYLAPSPAFTSRADAVADGRRIDELFDGPALRHGFLPAQLPAPRRTVRVSDLIHAIMDVPAVRTVRSLVLASSAETPRNPWALEVPPGKIAALAPSAELTLLRGGLPVRVDLAAARARLAERRLAARARVPTPDPRDLAPAPGRDRQLARHTSIRRQLPVVYGVGPLGLSTAASAVRQAQARQLAAYTLIFDQLLANQFAQLAHARVLLSPESAPQRTYFSEPVEDPRLAIDELLRDPAGHRAWLAATVERSSAGGDAVARRQRFLAHLLARYAEELGDYTQVGGRPQAEVGALVADREAFLRAYPRLSGARGSGHDLLADDEPAAGHAERLRHKLGLRDHPRFFVVEHILLRPIPEDSRQRGADSEPQVPLLAGVQEPDPWSLQVSYVFEAGPGSAAGDPFEQLVARTILAETPAHIRPHLHWFADDPDGADWTEFAAAWAAFRAAHRAYRSARLLSTDVPAEIHIPLRDARDRVIDLLGFERPAPLRPLLGRTYPLRDLPVPTHVFAAPGMATTIPIAMSQRGVVYTLCDRITGAAIKLGGHPIAAAGDGGTLALPTPPIVHDVAYRILASKPGAREAWLHTTVSVSEGVDAARVARIRGLPPLDPGIGDPAPTDARLAPYAAIVEVEVLASQEGVTYELVDHADPTRVVSKLAVVGTSDTIVLQTQPVTFDFDLRVRGRKAVGDPQHPQLREALLTVVLPLRVLADTTLSAVVTPAIVVHGGETVLRITGNTQPTVEYQLWRRRVLDSEFVYADPPPVPVITVDDGGRKIRIRTPARPLPLADFVAVGPPRTGTGGPLDLPLAALEDSLLIVTGRKHHRVAPGGDSMLDSQVPLAVSLAALVRPDPARELRVQVTINGLYNATTATLLLRDGQPGVYYGLTRDGVAIAAEGYFHQRSETADTLNKGVDALRIGGDFSVVRDPPAPVDPRTTPPLLPLLDIQPLPVGAELRVLARRATTDLSAELTRLARIDTVPFMHQVPPAVISGQSAQITIDATSPADSFKLVRSGVVLQTLPGDGDLAFDTGPLTAYTVFHVVVERSAPDRLPVERWFEVAFAIKP